MTCIGIVKIPFFILGAWAGKEATEGRQLNVLWVVGLVVLLAALDISPMCTWLNDRESVFRLVGLIMCCIIMKWTENMALLHRLLRWIGHYTLELYIFHLMIFASLPKDIADGYVRTGFAIGCAFILCVPAQLICGKVLDVVKNMQARLLA